MPLLVIIGPSGAGKSTLVRKLIEDTRIQLIPTWTTRPRRSDEQNDIEHIYTSDEDFDQQQFLAQVPMFGLPYRYGLPKFTVSDDVISVVMLRAPLIEKFRRIAPDFKIYEIDAPFADISNRLTERERHGEPTGSRLHSYETEVTLGESIADRVFHNNSTPDKLYHDIITALSEDF